MSGTIDRVACTKCRHKCDPWRSFCGECGSALEGACGACGAVNRPGDRFCGGCAKLLVAPQALVVATMKALPPPPIPKTAPHTIPIVILDDAIVSETERN